MLNATDDICYQLALANRIVAHEGVLDGFGHISVRHPENPNHYLLSRSRSPELVEPGDILEFDLDSNLITPGNILPYGECVIHGEIFRVGGGTVWLMQGWHSVGKAKKGGEWEAADLGAALKAELAKGGTRKETMNDVFAEGL